MVPPSDWIQAEAHVCELVKRSGDIPYLGISETAEPLRQKFGKDVLLPKVAKLNTEVIGLQWKVLKRQ